MSRTKACKKCGEVIFNINSTCEDVEFICEKCKSIYIVSCDKYTTYDKLCASCSNTTFKLKVNDYGNIEQLNIECTNCKSTPTMSYIDKNGNAINRSIREILIIQDSIVKIEDNVYNLESRIDDMESKIDYVEYDMVGSLSSKVNQNTEEISSIEYDVDSLSRELDSEISSLKSMIYDLERNIERSH